MQAEPSQRHVHTHCRSEGLNQCGVQRDQGLARGLRGRWTYLQPVSTGLNWTRRYPYDGYADPPRRHCSGDDDLTFPLAL